MEIIYLGFLASLLAGLATGIGAIPIFLKESFSDDTLDVLLGFAAGVMSAATAFSLLVPAIDLSGPWIAMGGLIIGAFLLHFIDRFTPHLHPVAGFEGPYSKLS
ncbi:MAG: ZIP family metal transporter, partial [Candidatus Methanomethylicia archaeon]